MTDRIVPGFPRGARVTSETGRDGEVQPRPRSLDDTFNKLKAETGLAWPYVVWDRYDGASLSRPTQLTVSAQSRVSAT